MLENGCKKEVMVTPMYCFDDLDRVKIDTSDRKNILFVGGFGHPPNEDAVLWFMKNVWKFIKGAIPECKFHIVGSKPTEKIKALASDDVIIEGYVDDNRLDEFYRNCKVAVVPLRYGAGVKGKVLEAMHKGIGLVSTRIGLEGLEDVDKYTKAYNNARKFAAAVIELYNNEDLLRTNMTNNLEFLKNHMSVEIGKEVFSKLFSK
ncbi:MAG: glycosyltransferase family 4 protein [Deferribacterales bacterium]|nr:glycosyltransferase family 4 protein [Deferribacterales bacterium]